MKGSNLMAMFNFQFEPAEKAKKPMRSYIDIDESGSPKARIYADEYDAVKSNPDFEPFLTGAGRNMATAQTAFNDEMQEARLEAVEKRIKAKKQEAVSAEISASEAGSENLYPGLDIYGRLTGGQTFKQRVESRQAELRALLEERAALEGTAPEISAPMPQVEEQAAPAVRPTAQAEPVRQTPAKTTVKVKNPNGVVREVPAEVWSRNAKQYIEQGYQLMP
jgi:hypothetical protein